MKLKVPDFIATANALVQLADGTDENGSLNIVNEFEVKCRIEHSNSVIYTKEGTKITLKQKAFIFEKFDNFKDDSSGFCTIDAIKYDIVNIVKRRNPDGSINHIVLEMI